MPASPPFWQTTPLEKMTRAQWESLCDGCGRCCLHKIRDEETGRVHHTEVACRLLDLSTARCGDYAHRKARVPDCIRLTPARLRKMDWLPPTCAYRLLAEGRDLPAWHPLRSGEAGSVARAGVSVAGRAVSEREAGALEDHVVAWPARWPRRAGEKPPFLPTPLQGNAR
ncbi:YcgN family cysteine cluster protein [Rubritepida flocculans]|uniref:YcgN family cysteine cluster protein n=1 Tax=Rubritepida flocculans TaxID=182403 RepID=UPI00042782AA|nr:YcgN family cysteine cluster protein [Rubritepida flocculans]